jgi:alkanesulfonate monooxygenase SsuD/methylene tetrahydromethanopterin reductase-like flavin-dependent oxidoreductase (luciferase family)
MRFGTFHLIGSPDLAPAAQRFHETLQQIELADALGLDSVWVAEHHFSNYGYSANPLMLIARASAHARRVRFGQAVVVTPFWHPIRLAEDIAIADLLTDGRLEVGLGRGYQPLEFHGFDVEQNASREIFQEQVELMRLAWTADDFTFNGRHYSTREPITVLPRPVQQPYPPIWLAVQSEASLDWAAANQCDVLLTGGGTDWDQLAIWCARFRERRPQGRIGILRHVFVTESQSEARAAVWQSHWQRAVADRLRHGEHRIHAGRNSLDGYVSELSDEAWWDRILYGPPDWCIQQLRRQAALGITDFLAWFDIGGLPAETVERSMRLFASEVMPALATTAVA